ncbi:hypothetical protein [Roseospira visakhapatnamensis]|uniref:Uncharacterized protein n=1 Tax=Roseospira visakhapatnamensis TaxID=390880 RepID=A0A7W6WA48_9PROT|nr:hypothetical protein [Roseospira visakhapatnamensis]MBB4266493.1 hypothetical protein [Roseospira visakhapatnamensis]
MPLSELKLDQSLVTDLETDADARIVAEATSIAPGGDGRLSPGATSVFCARFSGAKPRAILFMLP